MSFRHILLPAAMLLTLGLLSGCAGKSTLSEANSLKKEGNCAAAIAQYDEIIQKWESDRTATVALFNRGECLEQQGDYAKAFGNYYASQALACMAVKERKDPNPGMGTISLSAYCDTIIPEKMIKLKPKVSQQERADSIRYVRDRLPKRVDF